MAVYFSIPSGDRSIIIPSLFNEELMEVINSDILQSLGESSLERSESIYLDDRIANFKTVPRSHLKIKTKPCSAKICCTHKMLVKLLDFFNSSSQPTSGLICLDLSLCYEKLTSNEVIRLQSFPPGERNSTVYTLTTHSSPNHAYSRCLLFSSSDPSANYKIEMNINQNIVTGQVKSGSVIMLDYMTSSNTTYSILPHENLAPLFILISVIVTERDVKKGVKKDVPSKTSIFPRKPVKTRNFNMKFLSLPLPPQPYKPASFSHHMSLASYYLVTRALRKGDF